MSDNEDYREEIGGYERSQKVTAEEDLLNITDLQMLNRIINKMFVNYEDAYMMIVRTVSLNLHKNDVIRRQPNLAELEMKLKTVKNIKYLNPIAFVLGRCVYDDLHNEIDKQMLNSISKNLDNSPYNITNPITKTDIVRYSKMWIK